MNGPIVKEPGIQNMYFSLLFFERHFYNLLKKNTKSFPFFVIEYVLHFPECIFQIKAYFSVLSAKLVNMS